MEDYVCCGLEKFNKEMNTRRVLHSHTRDIFIKSLRQLCKYYSKVFLLGPVVARCSKDLCEYLLVTPNITVLKLAYFQTILNFY